MRGFSVCSHLPRRYIISQGFSVHECVACKTGAVCARFLASFLEIFSQLDREIVFT